MSTGADGPRSVGAAPDRPMRAWRRVGVLVARSALWFIAVLLAWTVLPRVAGLDAYTVSSGSMEPSLSAGDVVMIGPTDPARLEPGQIVALRRPTGSGGNSRGTSISGSTSNSEGVGTLVTHRVVEVLDNGDVRTQGDANPAPDEPAPADAVVGRARLVVPMAGTPVTWADHGRWGALAALLGGIGVITVVGLGWSERGGHRDPRTARPGARKVAGRRAARRRRGALATGAVGILAIGIAVHSAATPALAAFSSSTAASASVSGATPLHPPYVGAVSALGPVGHWRLGDAAPDPVLLADGFETFTGWVQERNGRVQAASSPVRTGSGSLRKTANNDPSGGRRSLSRTVGNDWTLSTWVYRPSPWSGGAQDRISVEDTSGNGYGIRSIHGGNERLQIERRTNDSGSTLASVNYAAPENQWYRLELTRQGSRLTASAFDADGAVLATVSDTDGVHGDFDTVAVRGGWDYYLDDLEVTTTVVPTFADTTGAPDATGNGPVGTSAPGLLAGDPDGAVVLTGTGRIDVPSRPALDGVVAARTVNAWIDPAPGAGRGVIWAEGNASHGVLVYRDGTTLHGRAWSTNWPDTLQVSASVPTGRSMVTLAVDSATGTAELFVGGAVVESTTAAPRPPLPAHAGASAIGGHPGPIRFHDGVASGPGAWFDGVIDEVSVHPTRLDEPSVASLFGAGS